MEAREDASEFSDTETNVAWNDIDKENSNTEMSINPLTKDQKPSAPEATTSQSENTPRNDYFLFNENGERYYDWDRSNAEYAKYQQEMWGKYPTIIKDFYKEDPVVKAMTQEEVTNWYQENHGIQIKRAFEEGPDLKPIPNPVLTFEQAFQHYPDILQEIHKQGFLKPSHIQSQGWPIILSGDDFIGISHTGSGKTLTFLLPAFIHIDGQIQPREERAGPTVLILVPTRELALQIHREVKKYKYKDITSACVFGGRSREENVQTIAQGADILIATPETFYGLVMADHIDINHFSYVVFDEADVILNMSFGCLMRLAFHDSRPTRQTVMTSASWPILVRTYCRTFLNNPILLNTGSLDTGSVYTVTQNLMFLHERNKLNALMEFVYKMKPNDKIIIFCGKRTTVIQVAKELTERNFLCESIYGTKEPDRETALEKMIDGTVNILVTTDLTSRGIDIKDLTHVINFDFPRFIEDYVYRVGRTGRGGKTGIALTFITKYDWAKARALINILAEANQFVPDPLIKMAQRFEAMIKKRKAEGRGRGSFWKRFSAY